MEKILPFICGAFLAFVFFWSFVCGLDRETKRQCIIAKDNCEKYSDAGACDPKYLKICDGVEDEE